MAMVVFAQVKEAAVLGAAVRVDAHALTQPQWLELAAIAAQSGARIEVAHAQRLTPSQRATLAETAGALILFDFGG